MTISPVDHPSGPTYIRKCPGDIPGDLSLEGQEMGVSLYKPEEAAEALGVGRTYVYGLMASGELESIKVGRLRRIPAECVDEYVRRLRQEQGGEVPQP